MKNKILFGFLILTLFLNSQALAFLPEIFDFQAIKFMRIKKEISENIAVIRNLNEEKLNYIKRSFAPWQRLFMRNQLNEFVEVKIFFQTRNDFYSPPVKKNFLLKRIILKFIHLNLLLLLRKLF